jgi:hypothetical protein
MECLGGLNLIPGPFSGNGGQWRSYLRCMAKKTKKPGEKGSENLDHSVNEPQATYIRGSSRRNTAKTPKPRGYDAKHSAGMIPGLAARMKEYLKTVRDGR